MGWVPRVTQPVIGSSWVWCCKAVWGRPRVEAFGSEVQRAAAGRRSV